MGWDRTKLSPALRQQIAAAEAQTVAARLPAPKPEPNPGHALVATPTDEGGSPERVTVRITRLACSLLDFDNGVGGCKYLVDAMRRESLIVNDDPASIDFEFRQVRVSTKAEQGTLIEIL